MVSINNFNSKIVGTILTNTGLDKSLNKKGIQLYRSDVGDKNVLQLMRQTGSIIGGENSGHIINLEYSPSGDGLMTSLLIMKIMVESGKSIDELLHGLELIKQFNSNLEIDLKKLPDELVDEISIEENKKLGNGRVLVRKSGTEPMLRISVESTEENLAKEILDSIKAKVDRVVA